MEKEIGLFLASTLPMTLITGWASTFFYTSLLTPRKEKKHLFAEFFIVLVILTLPFYTVRSHWTFGTLLVQIVILLVAHHYFEGRLRDHIVYYLWLLLNETIVELNVSNLYYLPKRIMSGNTEWLQLNGESVQGQIICTIMFLVCEVVYFKIIVPLCKECFLVYSRELLLAVLLPEFLIYAIPVSMLESSVETIYVIPYVVYCIAFMVLYAYTISRLYKKEKYRQLQIHQNELMRAQIELQKEREQELHDMRIWNHDVQNHLQTIEYLIHERKYEQAEEYVGNVLVRGNLE